MSSFERLLARALRQPAAAGTPCPTAETLAACFEGTLDRAEQRRVEHHASNCTRCSAHLAALVQLSDRLDAASEPRLAWWHRWRLLAPAAALAVTVAVWTALPRERVADLTRAAVPSAPALPASATAQPAPVVGVAQKKPNTAPQSVERKQDLRERAEDKPTARMASAPSADADRGMNDQLQRADTSVGARENTVTPSAPSVPPAAKDALDKQQAADSASPARAQAMSSPAARPIPAPQDAGAAALSSRGNALESDARLKAARRPLVVSTPQEQRTWRVVAGQIERSDDSGRSWMPEEAPLVRAPIAGSAPSIDACWIVDERVGILRRNADASWQLVTTPAATAAITGVDARSARAATVWTSDGQRFETIDAGATWHVLPR